MVRKEREPPSYKPEVGDKIICESAGIQYEAKVLSIGKDPKDNDKNPEVKYFVHYQGWNKNWDEYVDISRIQEFTENNVKAMTEARKRKSTGTKTPGSTRKKFAVQQSQANTSAPQIQDKSETITIDSQEPITIDDDLKLKIPEEMKTWLIDDDNNIKNKKLTIIPAKVPINTILKDFVAHRKTTSRLANESVLNELTLGIKDYFNVMLGSHLLYKFERLQYQTLLKDQGKEVDLAAHYGIIHLVRLFTKIGMVITNSTLEPNNVQTIINYMQDLLKFISKQTGLFDLGRNYTVAPPEYIKNALK